MRHELFPNYAPCHPLPLKVGVMSPSSYGSAAHGYTGLVDISHGRMFECHMTFRRLTTRVRAETRNCCRFLIGSVWVEGTLVVKNPPPTLQAPLLLYFLAPRGGGSIYSPRCLFRGINVVEPAIQYLSFNFFVYYLICPYCNCAVCSFVCVYLQWFWM